MISKITLPSVCAPPSTPFERRQYLQDLEATKFEMSIEEYVYLVEPYRTSTMIPPLPFPIRTSPLLPVPQQRLAKNPGVIDLVAAHLEQHSIQHYAIETCTLSKPGYAYTHLWKLVTTMRILVDVTDDVSTETWPAAANAIRLLLKDRGFPTMQVEILDPTRCLMPSLDRIQEQNNPVCMRHWNAIHQSVRDLLRPAAPTRKALALQSREGDPGAYVACVAVPYESKADWGHLRDVLLSIAEDAGPVRVVVEFQPGQVAYMRRFT
ncbi:MAG: hypothetical protein Q9166_005501 [cf. Caloplaca sp. 2 TL-2023]